MDSNKSSDDEIELLNPPTTDDNVVPGEISDQESSVNPAIYLCRGSSVDTTSINPASVHALKTACTSLQQKLNDKTKKYNELYQKNKLMQKALLDMNKPENRRQGMDDLCQDPSVVHAAGAGACSVEDEGMVAEQRAKQGYISHLEREVLRNTSAIARSNEEIQRLKRNLDERDREKKTLLQKIDQLQTELERTKMSSMSYDENIRTYEENIRKYEDTVRGKQQTIEDLEKQLQYLYQENSSLKETFEKLNKNSTKDAENRDLKSKLVVAEKEMTKLTIQYRELDQRAQEKEEELCRLRAQCNQYEIEAEITRKYRNSESGGGDEVDGDAEELMRALDMIKNQRSEVTSLMTQVQQQKAVIKELLLARDRESQSLGKAPSSYKEERGEAPGASIHQFGDEAGSTNVRNYVSSNNYSNTPITTITTNIGVAPVQEQVSSSQIRREISPITRRQSDRGDYRSPSRQPMTTSPRLKEQFVPTGNIHISEMRANEDQRAMRRSPGSNVFDATSPHLSPRSHAQSPQPQPLYMNISQAGSPSSQRRNAGPSLSDTIIVETQNSPRSRTEVQRNIEPNPSPSSPRNRMDLGRIIEQSPNSPRSRTEQQRNIMEPTLLQPIHLMPSANNGARPKQNYNQDDFAARNRFMENNSNSAQTRLPDRMTQSAILLRDEGNNDNNLMSRSMFSPNLTVEASERTSPERNDFDRPAPPPVWPRPENNPEPVYGNNIQRSDNNGPDYENIINIKPHAGTRRPVEEHEDTVFVNDLAVNHLPLGRTVSESSNGATDQHLEAQNPPQAEPSEVSALKICPVCNLEYSRLTMDQFQTHVFECFDNCEEPTTLQPVVATATDDDRQCPMCGEVFPLAIAQEMYEQHVLAHFGEEPMMERFELINS